MDTLTLANFAFLGPILATVLEKIMGSVPSWLKPVLPVVIGVVAGGVTASSEGKPWTAGLLNGLAMSGTAMWHHDANINGKP